MFKRFISALTSTAVVAGMAGAAVVVAAVATAAPATAETVNIGVVKAQMQGHTGKVGGNSGNCIRFNPPDPATNPPNKTLWVQGAEAAAGHGRPTTGPYNGQCPPTLVQTVPDGQSAIGITPTSASSVETDAQFLLGTMKHYNNPINVDEDPAKFVGNLNLELQGEVFSFPYELHETPNGCDQLVDPEQGECSDDILRFTSTPPPGRSRSTSTASTTPSR